MKDVRAWLFLFACMESLTHFTFLRGDKTLMTDLTGSTQSQQGNMLTRTYRRQ